MIQAFGGLFRHVETDPHREEEVGYDNCDIDWTECGHSGGGEAMSCWCAGVGLKLLWKRVAVGYFSAKQATNGTA